MLSGTSRSDWRLLRLGEVLGLQWSRAQGGGIRRDSPDLHRRVIGLLNYIHKGTGGTATNQLTGDLELARATRASRMDGEVVRRLDEAESACLSHAVRRGLPSPSNGLYAPPDSSRPDVRIGLKNGFVTQRSAFRSRNARPGLYSHSGCPFLSSEPVNSQPARR